MDNSSAFLPTFAAAEREYRAAWSKPSHTRFQPIFHVEHGGAEDEPLNLWSIVLLTPAEDRRYHRPFEEMVAAGWLPGFIEIYIAKDLGVELARLTRSPPS